MDSRMHTTLGRLRCSLVAVAALALAACGGGDPFSAPGAGGPGTGPADPRAASLVLLVSSPDLPSAGDAPVTVTALVRDTNNNVVGGVPVTFSANSGVLQTTAEEGGASTDTSGRASIQLAVGPDRANRTITVRALAGSLEESVNVRVVGTRIQVTGPTDVTLGETIDFTARLLDSANRGVPGQAIEVTSSLGNAISSDSLTTSENGEVRVTLSASQGGTDNVEFRWVPSAGSPALVQARAVGISQDQLLFVTPSSAAEFNLGQPATITVRRLSGGLPVAGEQVSFSSTRGDLSSLSALTDGQGEATVTIISSSAGPAIVTATQADGASVQRTIEFVATVPDSISLRATAFTVAPERTSDITAVLRDEVGNPVKNAVVIFSLNDTTGGRLTASQGVTDSTGRVSVVYEAGATTSAANAVIISAYPAADPSILGSVRLTVARRELFVTIGTDNSIRDLSDDAVYEVDFAIIVTDVDGVGVADARVNLSATPLQYRTGRWVPTGSTNPAWVQNISSTCPSEDVNGNGILDFGEDDNGNGRLDPGNVASFSAAQGGGGTVVTDSNGFGRAILTYPQDRGQWVQLAVRARTGVDGTEFLDELELWLPISAGDVNNPGQAPPGLISPYGEPAGPVGPCVVD